MNVFDAEIEPVEVMGLYRQMPLPHKKRGRGPNKHPMPPEKKRRNAIKVFLTDAEYAAVRRLGNASAIGRAAMLAAANKTGE